MVCERDPESPFDPRDGRIGVRVDEDWVSCRRQHTRGGRRHGRRGGAGRGRRRRGRARPARASLHGVGGTGAGRCESARRLTRDRTHPREPRRRRATTRSRSAARAATTSSSDSALPRSSRACGSHGSCVSSSPALRGGHSGARHRSRARERDHQALGRPRAPRRPYRERTPFGLVQPRRRREQERDSARRARLRRRPRLGRSSRSGERSGRARGCSLASSVGADDGARAHDRRLRQIDGVAHRASARSRRSTLVRRDRPAASIAMAPSLPGVVETSTCLTVASTELGRL